MKQVYNEVHTAEDLKVLEGCKVTSVSAPDGGEGLCIDCEDMEGNLVSFLVLRDGTWHLHEGENKQNVKDGALTREKILKLKPGREFDLHLAIDVAGMNIDEIDESKVLNYSTDDAAALALLKGFHEENYEVEINGHPDYGWYTTIKEHSGQEIASVCYLTLAESIGKAALLASNGF